MRPPRWDARRAPNSRRSPHTLHTSHYTLHTTHYTLHNTHYTIHNTPHSPPASTGCAPPVGTQDERQTPGGARRVGLPGRQLLLRLHAGGTHLNKSSSSVDLYKACEAARSLDLSKAPRSSSSLLRSSLELGDTNVYEPRIRARLGTAAHFCEVVVLKLRTARQGPTRPRTLSRCQVYEP